MVETIEEPTFVGEFPVRTELTVLPADPIPSKPISFIVKEYLGSEVFLLDPEGRVIEIPLLKREDLYPGVRICAPTLVGSVIAEVVASDDGDLYWRSPPGEYGGNLGGSLCFDIDDRHCWITTGAWNKRGVCGN